MFSSRSFHSSPTQSSLEQFPKGFRGEKRCPLLTAKFTPVAAASAGGFGFLQIAKLSSKHFPVDQDLVRREFPWRLPDRH